MILAALFDYDGTLVDSDAAHFACWNQALAAFQVAIDEDFFATYCVGALTLHITEQMKQIFPSISISAQALADEKDERFEQWIAAKTLPLCPGVPEMLGFLADQQVAIGIVTGAPLAGIEKTLRDHDIARFFSPIVTRESVARGKPAPDGYLLGLQQLNLPGQAAVSLEDTRIGVLAAKAAGLRAFAIPSRFTAQHDFTAADVVCRDMHEARKILLTELA